jgi:pilus assembly protein CpaF
MIDAQLADLLAEHHELLDLDAPARRLALRRHIGDAADAGRLADFIDGLGPLSELMRDELVSDVMVNGPNEVWVERRGILVRTEVSLDAGELTALIERVLGNAGERADMSQPIADARLADGSRIHVVMPPLAPAGPVLSIRRVPTKALGLEDMTRLGTMSEQEAAGLTDAVARRASIVVSGGTGTGKTTLLNALLATIDHRERVITVEETAELRPECPHWVSLVARRPTIEGAGGVDLGTLLRAALRMRPDRIVVGEVRGAEALVALEAMTTGHDGSLLTVHSSSAMGALDRLVLLAARAGSSLGEGSLRAQFEQAIDVVVHLKRQGERRVVERIVA